MKNKDVSPANTVNITKYVNQYHHYLYHTNNAWETEYHMSHFILILQREMYKDSIQFFQYNFYYQSVGVRYEEPLY